jgi:predicted TIM-barrel fold metal-dependent hydrolase
MKSHPYPVFDADNHLYEPPEAFLRHLPDMYKKEFQYVEVNGRTKLVIAGMLSEYIPNPTWAVVAAPGSHEMYYRAENPEGLTLREITGKPLRPPESFFAPEPRIKLLDEQGIDASLIFPTMASVIEERLKHKPEVICALFHALNQWILEEWGFVRDDRLYSVPFVNLSDIDQAVKELEFCLENGARTVGIRPAPVAGPRGTRSPGYKEFDPFWARVNEAGIFVCLHSSDSGYEAITNMWKGSDREFLPFEKSELMPVNTMERAISDTLTALLCHGVFERHTNVRVASIENTARWVPSAVETWKRAYGQSPKSFKRDPVEQFKEHVFVAPSYEDNIFDIMEYCSPNRLLFGSDYPHPEGLADPVSYVKELEGVDEVTIAKIMGGNLKGLLEGHRDSAA